MNKKSSGPAAPAEETAARTTENQAEREAPTAPKSAKGKKTGPQVYCGPTVRGVAKQYTVYSGGIPEELTRFIQAHPEAAGLVVPVEKFAQTRRRMETAGTAEAILYHKIKSEL